MFTGEIGKGLTDPSASKPYKLTHIVFHAQFLLVCFEHQMNLQMFGMIGVSTNFTSIHAIINCKLLSRALFLMRITDQAVTYLRR